MACSARAAYTAEHRLLLLLAWRFTRIPAHLLVLLGAACIWWLIALGG